tara:strand:- start:450 stop:1418 length:969 start_codon:yes stop_codon:yes gene_type:complete
MSDKKVFSINPELFSFSNTTKKRKGVGGKKEKIKMKSNKPSNKNDTLRKRSILRMIREHHSERNKDNFSKYQEKLTPSVKENDFEAAKNFFKNMKPEPSKNNSYTLKNRDPEINKQIPANSISFNNNHQIQTINANDLHISDDTISLNKVPLPISKHGCLKNGDLPTYRQYMNQTRKAYEVDNNNNNTLSQSKPSEAFDRANHFKQMEKLKNLKKKKRRLQKKTIRTTFKTGKSRIKPCVSVLLANKTIRSNVLEKEHKLKQVPIEEIRKYLIKHGFIRVGTTTPNDVLRKMYESALLICGEIQNYNSETLMYNFMNNDDQL